MTPPSSFAPPVPPTPAPSGASPPSTAPPPRAARSCSASAASSPSPPCRSPTATWSPTRSSRPPTSPSSFASTPPASAPAAASVPPGCGASACADPPPRDRRRAMRVPSVPSTAMSTGEGSVIIIGAGFGGIAAAIELQHHGFRDITILEAAPRPRRHVAAQQLSGRGVRRAEPPVLVLVRAAARLVAAVLAAARDPRLPPRGRRALRRRPARRTGTRGHRVRLGRRAAPLDGRGRGRPHVRGRARSSSRPASCTSRRSRASAAREDVRGARVPHRASGTTTTTCAASASR